MWIVEQLWFWLAVAGLAVIFALPLALAFTQDRGPIDSASPRPYAVGDKPKG